jgi:5-methyltetrahydrofolate--homocysteine methyltransferase
MGSAAIPAFAMPNAGKSAQDLLSPEEMAEELTPYIHSGASVIGGCCYTTWEHLRAMRALLDRAVAHGARLRSKKLPAVHNITSVQVYILRGGAEQIG